MIMRRLFPSRHRLLSTAISANATEPAEKAVRVRRNRSIYKAKEAVPRYGKLEVRTAPAALREIIHWCTEKKKRKFVETIDIDLKLSIDPRKPQQSIRTSVLLPNASGRKKKIAAFVANEIAESDEARQKLIDSGADIVGGDDLIDQVVEGKIAFETCVAMADVLPDLAKRAGKVLGSKGLLPNKKLPHSIAQDLTDLEAKIAIAAKGPVVLRTEPKKPYLHAVVGRADLGYEKLFENLKALILSIQAAKPEKAPKGQLILAGTITSTMGPGIPLDPSTISPNSPRFLRDVVFDKASAVRGSSSVSGNTNQEENQDQPDRSSISNRQSHHAKRMATHRQKIRLPPPNPATSIHYQPPPLSQAAASPLTSDQTHSSEESMTASSSTLPQEEDGNEKTSEGEHDLPVNH